MADGLPMGCNALFRALVTIKPRPQALSTCLMKRNTRRNAGDDRSPLSSLRLLKALDSTVTNSTVAYGNDY